VIRSRSASVFLNSCLHIIGCSLILVVDMEQKTWRKILDLVVLYPPSIKLKVTCVYVLLVVLLVTICPSFQSESLKTMLLINGY
jgi:hypothetical protein